MKLVLVGRSMEDLLDASSPPLSLLAVGAGWMAIRYVVAAHRHIYALQCGADAQMQDVLTHQEARFTAEATSATVGAARSQVAEAYALLRVASERRNDACAGLAVDGIPGTVSIGVGCYQLGVLLHAPYNLLCILFLMLSDVLHHRLCQYQAEIEDRNDARYQRTLALAYATGSEATHNAEAVYIFARRAHEMDRLRLACTHALAEHNRWSRGWNIQGSLRHWVAHVQKGTLLWLAHGHLTSAAQLVAVLFYVSEVQSGIREWRSYGRKRRLLRVAQRTLDATWPTPMPSPPSSADDDGFSRDVAARGQDIALHNVSLRRGHRAVLQQVSVQLRVGSHTAVLGGNGAGKTTLLRVLQGLYVPDEGRVIAPPCDAVLTCTQEPQLFGNASVPYNVAYGCRGDHLSHATAMPMVHAAACCDWSAFGPSVQKAACALGLMGLARTSAGSLSGGERQRIGLARVYAAVLEQPSRLHLLLLDEHDSALDCHGKDAAAHVVHHIQQLSLCTTLSITHAPPPRDGDGLARAGGFDDAIVMRGGGVVQQGPWPQVASAFFARPAAKQKCA